MSSASSEVRRARPLLGTFVEIGARGLAHDRLHGAIDRAFAAIERVHRLMSFHDPASDVSRLNRLAARRAVAVHPWTSEVLRQAQHFAAISDGDFDISVAPLLQKWGYLPREKNRPLPRRISDYRKIELLDRDRVRFHDSCVSIDLGGIAKGFAVDQAVRILEAENVVAGLVNAGGDLRALGSCAVEIRNPALGGPSPAKLALENDALATSAHYFARKRWRGRNVTPLVSPRDRAACFRYASVSVRAPSCLHADALAKIAMLRGPRAFPLLEKFAAHALLVTSAGEVVCSPGWHEKTRN
ncbi:MAG TPA: FAD:protein FMN transferase [Chthoniobacteraceae bacterium]|nr:FAD:protein FMN transferase [Chthoniobacteraceae bacterium]